MKGFCIYKCDTGEAASKIILCVYVRENTYTCTYKHLEIGRVAEATGKS